MADYDYATGAVGAATTGVGAATMNPWAIALGIGQMISAGYSSWRSAKTEDERQKIEQDMDRLHLELQKQIAELGKYPGVGESYGMLGQEEKSNRWDRVKKLMAEQFGHAYTPRENLIEKAFATTQQGVQTAFPPESQAGGRTLGVETPAGYAPKEPLRRKGMR